MLKCQTINQYVEKTNTRNCFWTQTRFQNTEWNHNEELLSLFCTTDIFVIDKLMNKWQLSRGNDKGRQPSTWRRALVTSELPFPFAKN